MAAGTTFLVERYLPGLGPADVAPFARRLAAASADLRAEGRDVHWLRSLGLAGDETCLCTFLAPSLEDVEEVNRRAGAPYERIVVAFAVEP